MFQPKLLYDVPTTTGIKQPRTSGTSVSDGHPHWWGPDLVLLPQGLLRPICYPASMALPLTLHPQRTTQSNLQRNLSSPTLPNHSSNTPKEPQSVHTAPSWPPSTPSTRPCKLCFHPPSHAMPKAKNRLTQAAYLTATSSAA